MGHTHYWKFTNQPRPLAWARLRTSVERLISAFPYALRGPNGGPPLLSRNTIYIDPGPDRFLLPGHIEHLVLTRLETPRWRHCKTQFAPFDQFVVATLGVAQDCIGAAMLLETDGDIEVWKRHMSWASLVLEQSLTVTLGRLGTVVSGETRS